MHHRDSRMAAMWQPCVSRGGAAIATHLGHLLLLATWQNATGQARLLCHVAWCCWLICRWFYPLVQKIKMPLDAQLLYLVIQRLFFSLIQLFFPTLLLFLCQFLVSLCLHFTFNQGTPDSFPISCFLSFSVNFLL